MEAETTIESILKRIKNLEHDIFLLKKQKIVEAMKESQDEVKLEEETSFTGVTGGIRFLISKGFFKERRTLGDIKEELEKNDYHSSLQAVQMAINRLSKSSGPLITFKENKKKFYAKRK